MDGGVVGGEKGRSEGGWGEREGGDNRRWIEEKKKGQKKLGIRMGSLCRKQQKTMT